MEDIKKTSKLKPLLIFSTLSKTPGGRGCEKRGVNVIVPCDGLYMTHST